MMDFLKHIKKVEASPYLLTRIEQKIQDRKAEEQPVRWAWTAIASLALILLLDLGAIGLNWSRGGQASDDFSLMPTNMLYDDKK